MRSGMLRRLSRVQRGFLRACLAFARRVGVISGRVVVSQLRGIIMLLSPPRVRALEAGWRRVREMFACFERMGVFRYAPQVRLWLMDESYRLYIGFMHLNEPFRMG
jgi:hypothetical protein